MSNAAITAAWRADVTPAARKLVLIYLADRMNEQTGQLNPSVTTVAKACGMSPRQAQRHMHDLEQMGLLQVIGNHFGGSPHATRRYRLNLPEVIHTGDTHDRGDMHDTGDTDDARGDTHDTPGVTSMTHTGVTDVTQSRREPEKNQKGTRNKERKRSATIDCPSDVDQKVWQDWMQLRKAKGAAVTQTVVEGARREADKAGMTLEEFLREWCLRGSQGLKAEWLQPKQGGAGMVNKQEALEQRNRAVVDSWLTSQGHKPTRRRMPEPENWHLKNYGPGGKL